MALNRQEIRASQETNKARYTCMMLITCLIPHPVRVKNNDSERSELCFIAFKQTCQKGSPRISMSQRAFQLTKMAAWQEMLTSSTLSDWLPARRKRMM